MNEREMLIKRRNNKDLFNEGPANNPGGGIRPNLSDGEKYSFYKDVRLRSLAA